MHFQSKTDHKRFYLSLAVRFLQFYDVNQTQLHQNDNNTIHIADILVKT